jgi:hypothetical protein
MVRRCPSTVARPSSAVMQQPADMRTAEAQHVGDQLLGERKKIKIAHREDDGA